MGCMKNTLLSLIALCFLVLPAMAQKEADTILSAARALQRNNDFAGAAAEMNKAIALEPNNTRYLFEQAQYYERAKDETSFLNNIDRALKLEPDNEETVMEAVRRLFTPGTTERCERSLAVINTFLANHPQSDKAYSWRFFIKQCLKDDAGAFADISEAVKLNPTYPLYQSNRANLVSRMGDTKLAQQLLKTLIETLGANLARTHDRNAQEQTKRDMGMSLRQLSLVYERMGDKTLATEALTQAIPYGKALYLRERALAYGRFAMYEDAITDLNTAIADDDEVIARRKNAPPDIGRNMTLYMERGNIFYSAGEYQNALADYRECLRLDPRNKALYEKLIDRVNQKIEKLN